MPRKKVVVVKTGFHNAKSPADPAGIAGDVEKAKSLGVHLHEHPEDFTGIEEIYPEEFEDGK